MQGTIENMWAFHIWKDSTPFSNSLQNLNMWKDMEASHIN